MISAIVIVTESVATNSSLSFEEVLSAESESVLVEVSLLSAESDESASPESIPIKALYLLIHSAWVLAVVTRLYCSTFTAA